MYPPRPMARGLNVPPPITAKKPMMPKKPMPATRAMPAMKPQGAMPTMADGGMMDGNDPDNDGDGGVKIDPSAVNYHDDPHACSGCKYFGQNSQCAVLQMQVSPEGGCTAFSAGGGDQNQDDQGDTSNGDQTADSYGESGDDEQ